MSNIAYLPIVADRYGALVRHIFVVGLDMTGIPMRAQVRLDGDTPGPPEVDLITVTNGNAEGLRLVEVTTDDAGVPTSHIEIVINETTMEGLPYLGEIGDTTQLRWDMQITFAGRKRRLARGEFEITGDGVTGADAAPVNRPPGYGRPRMLASNPWSAARLTFGEEQVTVTIADADLVAPLAQRAGIAADASTAARETTLTYRNQTFVARNEAQFAASTLIATTGYFSTRVAGEAGTSVGKLFSTKDISNNLLFYERTSGGSTPITFGAYATLAGAQTISGKTLYGAQNTITDGSRIGVTDAGSPVSAPGALMHIVNTGSITCGLRVSSYWTGTTSSPYQNNDNSLWEVFNRASSSSANFSWAGSFANAYNDIPVGVYDTGQRVALLGWATSVSIPGQYEHKGTLEFQFGVRGRAGFQGPGSTGTVNFAIGVRGEIYNDSFAATIKNGIAGEFVSNARDGVVERAYGIYAGAQYGTVSNYSFYGAIGTLFNQDRILSGIEFAEMPTGFAARGTGPRIEFGFPAGGGYGGSLGSTTQSGRPYVGWNAEAHSAGDTFTTRGMPGWVGFTASGNLIFGRVPDANAANQAQIEAMRLNSEGRAEFAMAPTSTAGYLVNGVTVIGARGALVADAASDAAEAAAATPTKAEFDAVVAGLRSAIAASNALADRLREHGLIAT